MAEQNIVIAGASYGGILTAHYIAKHIVTNKDFHNLRLVLISPSPDFFHRVGAPRGIVDGKLLPDDKLYYSLAEGFKQYPSSSYTIIQGTVTAIDTTARNLQYAATGGGTKSLPYHALILATGAPTTSPLFTSYPSTDSTRAAMSAFRAALPAARSVVIGGGGPVGVESAGEIGEFLNGTAGWFSSRPSNPKAKVTVITASKKLLPALREDAAARAEKYLNRVGVDVIYNKKIVSVTPDDAGSTVESTVVEKGEKVIVRLDDGQIIEADIYIPAFGVQPQAKYLSKDLLTQSGHIKTNPKTLRVDEAGPRVYAIGDGSSASPGGILHIMHMVPVIMSNLKRDLAAAQNGKNTKETGKDREYEVETRATQVVPIGRSKGVGQAFGWWVPSFFVWLLKGREYLVSMIGNYTDGKLVRKEDVWKYE